MNEKRNINKATNIMKIFPGELFPFVLPFLITVFHTFHFLDNCLLQQFSSHSTFLPSYFTSVKNVHLSNADFSIVVTLSGILIYLK